LITHTPYPLRISFELTHHCQLNCIFCEPHTSRQPTDTKACQVMNKAEIERALENCMSLGPSAFFFTGGEPLLRRDLEELAEVPIKSGHSVCISTNGHLLSRERCQSLLDVGLNSVQISIQGIGEVHDEIVRMEGAFKKTLIAATNATEVFGRVEIATVLMRSNLSVIPNLYKRLLEEGVKGTFRVLRPMCFTNRMLGEVVTTKGHEWLVRKLREMESNDLFVTWIGSVPGQDTLSPSDLYYPLATTCYAGKTTLTVLPWGDVVPCQSLRSIYLGHILKNSLNEIWNGSAINSFRKPWHQVYDGMCGICENKPYCYSCRAVALALTGKLTGDDVSCQRLNPIQRQIEDCVS
jgi:MoaA/NifB/PqqE/SkfB family radical SAM enzyme